MPAGTAGYLDSEAGFSARRSITTIAPFSRKVGQGRAATTKRRSSASLKGCATNLQVAVFICRNLDIRLSSAGIARRSTAIGTTTDRRLVLGTAKGNCFGTTAAPAICLGTLRLAIRYTTLFGGLRAGAFESGRHARLASLFSGASASLSVGPSNYKHSWVSIQ